MIYVLVELDYQNTIVVGYTLDYDSARKWVEKDWDHRDFYPVDKLEVD